MVKTKRVSDNVRAEQARYILIMGFMSQIVSSFVNKGGQLDLFSRFEQTGIVPEDLNILCEMVRRAPVSSDGSLDKLRDAFVRFLQRRQEIQSKLNFSDPATGQVREAFKSRLGDLKDITTRALQTIEQFASNEMNMLSFERIDVVESGSKHVEFSQNNKVLTVHIPATKTKSLFDESMFFEQPSRKQGLSVTHKTDQIRSLENAIEINHRAMTSQVQTHICRRHKTAITERVAELKQFMTSHIEDWTTTNFGERKLGKMNKFNERIQTLNEALTKPQLKDRAVLLERQSELFKDEILAQLSKNKNLTAFIAKYPNKYSYKPTTGRFTAKGEMTLPELLELKTIFTDEGDQVELDKVFKMLQESNIVSCKQVSDLDIYRAQNDLYSKLVSEVHIINNEQVSEELDTLDEISSAVNRIKEAADLWESISGIPATSIRNIPSFDQDLTRLYAKENAFGEEVFDVAASEMVFQAAHLQFSKVQVGVEQYRVRTEHLFKHLIKLGLEMKVNELIKQYRDYPTSFARVHQFIAAQINPSQIPATAKYTPPVYELLHGLLEGVAGELQESPLYKQIEAKPAPELVALPTPDQAPVAGLIEKKP